jgi:hypothetical protein
MQSKSQWFVVVAGVGYALGLWGASRPVGAASGPAHVAQAASQPGAQPTIAGPETRVVILDPALRFESVTDESPVPMNEGVLRAYSDVLSAQATAVVQRRKLAVVDIESTAGVAEIAADLQPLVARLARGALNADTVALLARLAAIDQNFAVLAIRMRAKSGVGGSWNPNTGAITSSMNTTELSAALVSRGAGRVVWKNDVALRKVPSAASKDFLQKVAELFKGL